MYDFFWVACLLAYENFQGNYSLRFFPTDHADAGDFTCLVGFFSLMREILHACRESGRNSVQAGDSLSMRESWKPWIGDLHVKVDQLWWMTQHVKYRNCQTLSTPILISGVLLYNYVIDDHRCLVVGWCQIVSFIRYTWVDFLKQVLVEVDGPGMDLALRTSCRDLNGLFRVSNTRPTMFEFLYSQTFE